jgi:hypothetical protein
MIAKGVAAFGTINKAWAAAIAAPLAEWLVSLMADALWSRWQIAMPDSAGMAVVSLVVGLVVYHVPNLSAEPTIDGAERAGV